MTEPADSLNSLQHDLRWAINSQEPTHLPAVLPWHDESDWFAHWLRTRCDQGADELRLISLRTGRLGKYFEALWAAYFEAHPDWQIRLSHQPVYHQKRTLGELDFVVSHNDGPLLHLELAVKFYLLAGEANNLAHWVGPNLKDSLGRKYQHLTQHQLKIGQHQDVSAMLGRAPDDHKAIIKGRFFVPASHDLPPDIPQWLTRQDALTGSGGVSVRPLSRQQWLTGGSTRPWWPLEAWLAIMGNDFQPMMVCWAAPGQNTWYWRFIVPDTWPQQARAFIEDAAHHE